MDVILRIVDWDDNFENSKTRTIQNLRWVPIPNKHDSDGYTQIIDHPDGPAHYACWVAITQVASKCHPRGTLLRGVGQGHDSASLSRMTRMPQELFESAIPRLISVGWLERISSGGTVLESGCWEGDGRPSGDRRLSAAEGKGIEGKGIEGKGIEGKEKKPPLPVLDFDLITYPDGMDTPEVRQAITTWLAYKRKRGQAYKDPADQMGLLLARPRFNRDPATFVEAVSHSKANNWAGCFPPEESDRGNQTTRPGQAVRSSDRGRVRERDWSDLDQPSPEDAPDDPAAEGGTDA